MTVFCVKKFQLPSVNTCHQAARIPLLWKWVWSHLFCLKLLPRNLPSEESLWKSVPWPRSSKSFWVPISGFVAKGPWNLSFQQISKWFFCPRLFEKCRRLLSIDPGTEIQALYILNFYSYDVCLELYSAFPWWLPLAIQKSTNHVSVWRCYNYNNHHRVY